jgi:SAM-dependent methyltransferase
MLHTALHAHNGFHYVNGIFEQSYLLENEFEKQYIALRKKENRILSDVKVSKLPSGDFHSPLKQEWSVRKSSAVKLKHYIGRKLHNKFLLEVGCGNGWLCNMLSQIEGTSVIGIDVNKFELEQASRVFGASNHIAFVLGNIYELDLPIKFDHIVMASSIQYFEDARTLISNLLHKLSTEGEIHILDSPIYHAVEVANARLRSESYFNRQDSEMSKHYHHHSWDDFKDFTYEKKFDPDSLSSMFTRRLHTQSPFPWVVIRKKDNGQ